MSVICGYLRGIVRVIAVAFIVSAGFAQTPTPSSTLLVLAKSDNTVAIVDPATLQVLARIPAGLDPHEIIASDDGKLAFISNYGGSDSTLNTISVVDLVARKALPPIDLGALRSTHGLDFRGRQTLFHSGDEQSHWPIRSCDPARGLDSRHRRRSHPHDLRFEELWTECSPRTSTPRRSASSNKFHSRMEASVLLPVDRRISSGPPPQGPGGRRGTPRMTWEVTNVPSGSWRRRL